MRIKTLLGERVLVLPDNSDEKTTPSGIIIPQTVNVGNNHLKSGVITKKGQGTPWNRMDDVHVKQRVMFRRGAGKPYEEETEDGIMANYLMLSYSELILV